MNRTSGLTVSLSVLGEAVLRELKRDAQLDRCALFEQDDDVTSAPDPLSNQSRRKSGASLSLKLTFKQPRAQGVETTAREVAWIRKIDVLQDFCQCVRGKPIDRICSAVAV